tara:strand:+ start:3812 stop:4291 length:480 start_codon:yes stop_codon:yes gene_type:complete
MDIDQREYRNAVGRFATGVTIVTTVDEEGDKVGITANSFSSLSLLPPLVLFCVDDKINSFETFEHCEYFNINILREEQVNLSNNFARSGDDKWEGVKHDFGDNGCPIFKDSIAILECEKHAMYKGGDHTILIGEVKKMRYDDSDCRPLIYFGGSYAKLE